ncbi:MAG: DUF512 domain-containing protein [Clostridiales bacterium]|nr:DUF512 domain-containing protein [Candidatus Cacconaster stercorequi]
MSTVITSIDPHSPALRAGIQVGEKLLTINGHEVLDVLDYRFYGYDPVAQLTLLTPAGETRALTIHKMEGQDLGLNFDTYLMDEMRQCANHCVFCFVDQMPPNMRSTLYVKDDDARLSFLLGNYTTLTNISPREAQRIIDLHISPINVSVHATDPQLRCTMLGNKNAMQSLDYMRAFGEHGIVMNGQIVVCPGWNDGDQLRRTMHDLLKMNFASCSIVPVGITKYRQGLAKLRPVDAQSAGEIIDIVDEVGEKCLREKGTRVFFCADELYLKAGRPLPEDDYYEEYRQLENGVGLLRLLEQEFMAALRFADAPESPTPFTIATGTSAAPYLSKLVEQAKAQFPEVRGQVIGIENDFFGRTIDVAGLVTGQDLAAQLKGRDLGERVLIPISMLRHGENVFLDDYTVPQLAQELGCRVEVISGDGGDLADAMLS